VADAESTADGFDGSWEAARQRKLTLALEATPAQRLAWLEDAIRFAHAAGALPRPKDGLTPARRTRNE
jgi:hypothetical protein